MLSRPLRTAARSVGVEHRSSLRTASNGYRKATGASFIGQPRRNMNSRSVAPYPPNEPIYDYKKGSPERVALEAALKELRSAVHEVPIIIGGKEIKTSKFGEQAIPHEHNHVLARFSIAGEAEVKLAIESSLKARKEWAAMSLDHRIAIFLKAADLLTGPWRAKVSAATILGQSKNFFQSEIDCICELADFWRFNARYAQDILVSQPHSSKGVWNRLEYRPLEGFIYAVTPFNFTAIGGNLVSAPAVLGNVVVWKPADNAMLSNYFIMKILEEAGMPPGVINFVPGNPVPITNTILAHPEFAGLHFTGSTAVFRQLWKQIANNIDNYRTYPRIVGETGGKDFVFAHQSADPAAVATAIVRGAFEFAGQKCSAASRGYIPASIWPQVLDIVKSQLARVKLGNPEEQDTFVNAVIHRASFNRCSSYIEFAKSTPNHTIHAGGKVNDNIGYFVEPTLIQTTDPNSKLLREEIFGPIFTVYVYDDAKFEETLEMCNRTAEYALTGSIFARDRTAIATAEAVLVDAAGNFYINDKPTGAVVGQQPFGGSRGSGTNDKAGSHLNLLRWVSPRTVKETFVPPTDFPYPYMYSK